MSAGRLKLVSLAALVLLAGGLVLTATQTWFVLEVSGAPLAVGGDVAGGAALAVGLAGLAAVAALALAGPFFRIVLGALVALLGAAGALAAGVALADPVAASAPALTAATGVAGHDSLTALVTGGGPTGWPVAALVVAILLGIAGLAVTLTARAWPRGTRRYERTRLAGDGAENPNDAVGEWDALSDGDDPTAR
ncbi:MAG: Trp biosynthesis-associated membrane protein [Actinomycetales bacterium]|nr:Trp biosynthesis-associated membrane protein [Actinomycetales bacterium]